MSEEIDEFEESSEPRPSRIKLWIGLLLAFLVADLVLYYWWSNRPEYRYDLQIRTIAPRYGLEPALVKAVIWQESRFRADAIGRAGEIGLMQVREDAAYEWAEAQRLDRFDHREIRDPSKNIAAGSFYLAKLLKRYQKADNPLPYALADYNAGRTHVLRWNKGRAQTNSAAFLHQMDYPTTRQYALNIMERYARYRQEFN
jgi:soluble lytic murein transglycosylase